MADFGGTVDLLWVIHKSTFHYICICQKVLELKAIVGLRNRKPLFMAGLLFTGEDYLEVGTWMDCPACNTRFRVASLDYDDSNRQSGCIKAEIGITSGSTNSAGARLRMMMLEDADDT